MLQDLHYLARRMDQIGKAVEADTIEFGNAIARRVHYNVVEYTPVDVGTARSNWIVRLGASWQFVYRAFSPGKFLGRSERGNLNAATAQARGVIDSRRSAEDIYITNNLPYIGRLNNGWSRQSAAGFVQRAIVVGVSEGKREFNWPNLRRL